MKEFWDERYASKEYVYGTAPNDWFNDKLKGLQPGKILLPAEGEGRNAVYAARMGWSVSAFDISEEGKRKALELARANQVIIDYVVSDAEKIKFKENSFDCLGLFYAHFSANTRKANYQKLITFLRPGGQVIFEAFSKKQIAYQEKYNSGGPKEEAMLLSLEEIRDEFPSVSFTELEEKEVTLSEGAFHHGLASVIRFFGIKN